MKLTHEDPSALQHRLQVRIRQPVSSISTGLRVWLSEEGLVGCEGGVECLTEPEVRESLCEVA